MSGKGTACSFDVGLLEGGWINNWTNSLAEVNNLGTSTKGMS